MTPLFLNIGTTANDGTGDTARVAGTKINTTFARVASALAGVSRVDLRGAYSAPLDGTARPLSALGLAAAQFLYPNIGLTPSTNLALISQDSAALAQAEYDLRIGSGGIIGLADGARPMLSGQFAILAGAKVWLHGGRDVLINTAGCGTTPALKITGARTGKNLLILQDLELTSGTAGGPSVSGGGTPHTLFTPGAAAFAMDNVIAGEFKRVAWSGYDKPFVWGDEIYNIHFEDWSAGSNNVGVNWDPTGADSMERVIFSKGCASNNNIGVAWNASYSGGVSQGGSVYFSDSSIDYSIVRALEYTGKGETATSCGNSFHLTRCHVETSGACSGNSKTRILAAGAYFMSECELYELDGTTPVAVVQVGDYSHSSAVNNRLNSNTMAIFYSPTANLKYVYAVGNVNQDINTRVVMLIDGNGTHFQPVSEPGQESVLIFDPVNPALTTAHYGRTLLVDFYNGNATFWLPAKETFGWPTGYVQTIVNVGATTTTFAVQTGTGLTSKLTSLQPGAPLRLAPGGTAYARMHDHSTGEWVISGQLTV